MYCINKVTQKLFSHKEYIESLVVDDVWPERKLLETFLDESAHGLLSRIIRNYYDNLSEQLSLAMSKLNRMHRDVIEAHDEVYHELSSHNASLKLDSNFIL